MASQAEREQTKVLVVATDSWYTDTRKQVLFSLGLNLLISVIPSYFTGLASSQGGGTRWWGENTTCRDVSEPLF